MVQTFFVPFNNFMKRFQLDSKLMKRVAQRVWVGTMPWNGFFFLANIFCRRVVVYASYAIDRDVPFLVRHCRWEYTFTPVYFREAPPPDWPRTWIPAIPPSKEDTVPPLPEYLACKGLCILFVSLLLHAC